MPVGDALIGLREREIFGSANGGPLMRSPIGRPEREKPHGNESDGTPQC